MPNIILVTNCSKSQLILGFVLHYFLIIIIIYLCFYTNYMYTTFTELQFKFVRI